MLYFWLIIQHLLYNVNTIINLFQRVIALAYFPRLRDLREDSDLTQNQLVEILHMHKTTYTNYEQGKREIPFSLVVRLAKFYNVTLDYIAGLTNEPRPLAEDRK